jgi:hypothetical protein
VRHLQGRENRTGVSATCDPEGQANSAGAIARVRLSPTPRAGVVHSIRRDWRQPIVPPTRVRRAHAGEASWRTLLQLGALGVKISIQLASAGASNPRPRDDDRDDRVGARRCGLRRGACHRRPRARRPGGRRTVIGHCACDRRADRRRRHRDRTVDLRSRLRRCRWSVRCIDVRDRLHARLHRSGDVPEERRVSRRLRRRWLLDGSHVPQRRRLQDRLRRRLRLPSRRDLRSTDVRDRLHRTEFVSERPRHLLRCLGLQGHLLGRELVQSTGPRERKRDLRHRLHRFAFLHERKSAVYLSRREHSVRRRQRLQYRQTVVRTAGFRGSRSGSVPRRRCVRNQLRAGYHIVRGELLLPVEDVHRAHRLRCPYEHLPLIG